MDELIEKFQENRAEVLSVAAIAISILAMLVVIFLGQNLRGPEGELGVPGLVGVVGDRGFRGEAGQAGAQGTVGSKGDTGDKGDTGERGDKGDAGTPGGKGDKGDRGETVGVPGSEGAPGLKGSKGDRGDQGEIGEPGLDGSNGGVGPQGNPGQPGKNGEPGFIYPVPLALNNPTSNYIIFQSPGITVIDPPVEGIEILNNSSRRRVDLLNRQAIRVEYSHDLSSAAIKIEVQLFMTNLGWQTLIVKFGEEVTANGKQFSKWYGVPLYATAATDFLTRVVVYGDGDLDPHFDNIILDIR